MEASSSSVNVRMTLAGEPRISEFGGKTLFSVMSDQAPTIEFSLISA